ncbi:hypothetical protein, partial [Sphingomonas sp. PB2P19]|uniref:hypothetical protein n=1 Tax=Sphingomonas rhamnosi TaxID=3096156 RepID=UPI003FA6C2BF
DPRSPMMRRPMPTAKTTMPRQTTSTHQNALAKPAIRRRLVSAGSTRVVNDRLWVVSDLGVFGQHESVFNIHAAVADGTFDFHMAKQNLNCAQIACGDRSGDLR